MPAQNRWSLLVLLLGLVGWSSTAVSPPAQAQGERKPRVLVLSASIEQSRFLMGMAPWPEAEPVEPGQLSGSTPAEKTRSVTLAVVDLERLPEAELSQAAPLLLELLRQGKGVVLVGIPEERSRTLEQLAGTLLQPGPGTAQQLYIVDAGHPITQGLTTTKVATRFLQSGELPNDSRALVTTFVDGGLQPVVWVRQVGSGRAVFLLLDSVWLTQSPWIQAIYQRGWRWAAGELNVDRSIFRYVQVEGIPIYQPDQKIARQTQMQEPLNPATSMSRMALPEGFRVELFAAEPDVVKPIAMTFDARGRLWVIESVDYPNDVLPNPDRQGHDRIKICEDTDGDGRADRFRIFAENLNIPTSLLCVRDGVLVACPPYILFLRDTDGDDVADRREVLFRGFGRYDTHAVHSNFHYGLDNWIWATVGYSGGRLRVGDRTWSFRQGIFRFKPDGSAFEFVAPTTNNTWGLGITPTGHIFASTANNQHAFYLAIPNRYFEQVRGWYGVGIASIEDHKRYHPIGPYRQVDFHGGFTAASGFEFYGDVFLPPPYGSDVALVCEPTGHLIHICFPKEEGSHFRTRDGYNLLASDDEWTAPIVATPGPDGAIWFIDWYNYVVQHNPTPPGFETGPGNAYVTPLRDKKHGRIYRIIPPGGIRSERPHLDRASADELVRFLSHPSMWWRLQAQRLLVERQDRSAVAGLVGILRDAADPLALLHALWTLHGLGALEQVEAELFHRLARHRDPIVRRAVVQTIPRGPLARTCLIESRLLEDPNPKVRLAAFLTVAELPEADDFGEALWRSLTDPLVTQDRWLPEAATVAAAAAGRAFLKAAFRQASQAPTLAALRAVEVVAEHLARGQMASETVAELLKEALGAEPTVQAVFARGFAEGWPEERLGPQDEALTRAFLHGLRAGSGLQKLWWLALARKLGYKDLVAEVAPAVRGNLLGALDDPQRPAPERLEAARGLLALEEPSRAVPELLQRLGPQLDPQFAESLLRAVAASDSSHVPEELLKRWRFLSPNLRHAAISLLLQRPTWTQRLVQALEEGHLRRADLALDQIRALTQYPNPELARRAKAVLEQGGSPTARAEVLKAYLPLASRRGDMDLGRKVFEAQCSKCHRFEGIGQSIGPDLTGIAVRTREELLTDILDPNRSVEGNYVQYTVVTRDGQVLNGLLAAESQTAVELIDSEGQKHVLLREDIEEMVSSTVSLMPEGFEQQMTPEELVALLEFLTAPRKYLSIPLRQATTAVTTLGMFYDREAPAERLIFDDWGPKEFKGVPFHLIDPQGNRVPNAILLFSPMGAVTREMPRQVEVACNSPAKAIHLLGAVAGWGYPASRAGTVSMIVRLHYADGSTEDHELINGVHIADYIRPVEVPGSELAFEVRGRQVRHCVLYPQRTERITKMEFLKGRDVTAPIILAVTIELPDLPATH
jgi:putative membrane-bound dehydrogenase-like protein